MRTQGKVVVSSLRQVVWASSAETVTPRAPPSPLHEIRAVGTIWLATHAAIAASATATSAIPIRGLQRRMPGAYPSAPDVACVRARFAGRADRPGGRQPRSVDRSGGPRLAAVRRDADLLARERRDRRVHGAQDGERHGGARLGARVRAVLHRPLRPVLARPRGVRRDALRHRWTVRSGDRSAVGRAAAARSRRPVDRVADRRYGSRGRRRRPRGGRAGPEPRDVVRSELARGRRARRTLALVADARSVRAGRGAARHAARRGVRGDGAGRAHRGARVHGGPEDRSGRGRAPARAPPRPRVAPRSRTRPCDDLRRPQNSGVWPRGWKWISSRRMRSGRVRAYTSASATSSAARAEASAGLGVPSAKKVATTPGRTSVTRTPSSATSIWSALVNAR